MNAKFELIRRQYIVGKIGIPDSKGIGIPDRISILDRTGIGIPDRIWFSRLRKVIPRAEGGVAMVWCKILFRDHPIFMAIREL